MDLDQLRHQATVLFPDAVRFAVANPGKPNEQLDRLNSICSENYAELGYSCQHDCFSEVIPKLQGELSLEAWCTADLEIAGWQVKINMRPFYLGGGFVHFEIHHDGPMGKFTETGYRSHFTPLATFSEFSPEEYLALIIGPRPREQQLSLF